MCWNLEGPPLGPLSGPLFRNRLQNRQPHRASLPCEEALIWHSRQPWKTKCSRNSPDNCSAVPTAATNIKETSRSASGSYLARTRSTANSAASTRKPWEIWRSRMDVTRHCSIRKAKIRPRRGWGRLAEKWGLLRAALVFSKYQGTLNLRITFDYLRTLAKTC